ncbi:Ni/Fe-hydrogenase, b-type cytochrome subunit [Phaeovibrio sulfidiphilus]|uniref:Probable Ni/Fe-hydrogenase B-type cytochrome subunit n=1 Tax=Phaeovibrio sulfidiphilus TaxID=1220600 RepID=A0A8J6YVH2_9PROT|nr:Ni/Fe-hydrogenase, b-type cytochrome subunit [Phaeovibrio sulfidiphilus]MBE1236492.1 Ni/Fe-hydrogenase, b-type cytochrome subunit [Phaeovibrio sulfidiphilus]
MATIDDFEIARRSRMVKALYIYRPMNRLWHWVNAATILVLMITGFFMGRPFPSVEGDTSVLYVMGWLRYIHFVAGWILLVGFVLRVYLALSGNRYARELFLPDVLSREWWKGLFTELAWYMFLIKEPPKYAGHNPLAQFLMFCFFVVGLLVMLLTGFALFSEAVGQGSWADHLFGWVIELFGGNSLAVHAWHRLGMWCLIFIILAHIYTAVREDIMSRQSMVSTMISGWRMFKD